MLSCFSGIENLFDRRSLAGLGIHLHQFLKMRISSPLALHSRTLEESEFLDSSLCGFRHQSPRLRLDGEAANAKNSSAQVG